MSPSHWHPAPPKRASRSWHALLVSAALVLGVLTPVLGAPTPANAAAGCPCSVFSPTSTPAVLADSDTSAVELGMKLRADLDGVVTGVRFYKGTTNTGSHVGRLWTTSGTLLASVTFIGESASGWQQALFATPVPVTAGQTYVVSYFAPNGRYSVNEGAFAAAGVDNGSLHALRDGQDGPNGVYRYGTGGVYPTNTYASSNYWVDVVYDTSAVDATPPTLTSTSPASGATGVLPGTTVAAVFSEPVQAATITMELKNPAGTAVPATSTYDAPSRTATLTPTSALAVSTAYTATVSGAKDPSGNTMTTVSWSFTTAASPSACPCSIWPATAVPGNPSIADSSAVELGVRWRSSSSGFISAIRFYKGTGNTGTHIGSLWTNTGTRLSIATFSGESATGWQQVTLPQPVPVTAGTSYVASYHTDTGHYAGNNDFFATSGTTRGPLTALATGVDGGNGLYLYGAGGFPTQTFRASNYWVDVVFDTTATDTTAPTLIARAPAPDAVGVPTSTKVTATFSEPVTASSVSVVLSSPGGAVAGSTAYDVATTTATFTPDAALAASTAYSVTVSGAKDASNNTMAPVSWSFTTGNQSSIPPDQGPGGPIVVITSGASGASPYSSFAAEILRTEGLNEFAVTDLGGVTRAVLDQYDVAVLGSTPLTAAQATMISDWVTAGGRLIAFRPDASLAGLLGLTSGTTTLANGYLEIDTTLAPGAGLTDQRIQYHGLANQWTLNNGTRAVSRLYANATTTTTTNPAVSLVSVGTLGGQAAAFAYDLPQSIVQMRQGNPAWAGQDRDGASPIRSDDLYFGGTATDWVNLSKVAIPQADEQQRLLANLIQLVNTERKPLPRFWYFPRSAKAVVIATGDDHGNGGTAGRFDQYLANSVAGCLVASWECPRFTSYIYASTPLSNSQAASYTSSGFEVGLHTSSGCADWTPSSLDGNYSSQLSDFQQKYTSIASPATNRLHCIVWSDWSSQAKVEKDYGMRLDTNYYYWPASWVNDRPGFMTGSGMPMRFVDTAGSMVDTYQAATQMTDESGQSYPATPNALLDKALGPEGYYGAFTANMHTESATTFQSDQLLASATSRGVPIVSAKQMLTWLDGRNSSSFKTIAWNAGTLSFTVSVGAGAGGLTAMLPTRGPVGTTLTALSVGGSSTPFTRVTIKGIEYAVFAAQAGTYSAAYGAGAPAAGGSAGTKLSSPSTASTSASVGAATTGAKTAATTAADSAAPAVSSVDAFPLPDGTAEITWQTNENTVSSMVLGTSPEKLGLELSAAGRSEDPHVVATGLRPSVTYYYRVVSVDAAGNRTTVPDASVPPLSFVSAPHGVADRSLAQFRMTKGGSSTYVQQDALGELSLAPAEGQEFDRPGLPGSLDDQAEVANGGTVVTAGSMSLDGRRVGRKVSVGPGRSLSFRATFQGTGTQYAGWATGAPSQPFAMVGLRQGTLYAAVRTGSLSSVALPADLIGSAHDYRIEWTSKGFTFFVDDRPRPVATFAASISSMRPQARDLERDGVPLVIDWVRMSGYATSGTFQSRILDAQEMVTWDRASWRASVPVGTTLRVSVRTGSTATPDSTWSGWTTLSGTGARVVGESRYVQYRVDMTTTVPRLTPVLRGLGITNSGVPLDAPTETGPRAKP